MCCAQKLARRRRPLYSGNGTETTEGAPGRLHHSLRVPSSVPRPQQMPGSQGDADRGRPCSPTDALLTSDTEEEANDGPAEGLLFADQVTAATAATPAGAGTRDVGSHATVVTVLLRKRRPLQRSRQRHHRRSWQPRCAGRPNADMQRRPTTSPAQFPFRPSMCLCLARLANPSTAIAATKRAWQGSWPPRKPSCLSRTAKATR